MSDFEVSFLGRGGCLVLGLLMTVCVIFGALFVRITVS